MMRFLLLLLSLSILSCGEPRIPAPEYKHEKYEMPDEKYGTFLREVLFMEQIPDKQFLDAIPNKEIRDIINLYRRAKNDTGFSLKEFIEENFDLPEEYPSTFSADRSRSIEEHIEALWPHLQRKADSPQPEGSTRIRLPYPYMVNEVSATDITYWDSYFTLLGMVEAGNIDIVQYMVDNYTHLIDEIGYVPSSNRTYNATYSQPPFFTSMVELLASAKGEETIIKYYPQIRKEYNYWMKMTDALSDENVDSLKVVKVDNYILNRYRDENPWPRADQYRNDVSLASNVDWRQNWEVFRDLRGGAESGWNFTGRWFSRRWRSTIMTSEILPVDLNSILFHIEKTLYDCYQKLGNQGEEMRMKEAMEKRKEAINTIFWDDENGIYADYEYGDTTVRDCPSLAMAYPLFFEIASQEQADSVAQYIQDKFLAQGGVVSSTMDYGQRWDYPNGWPHLHWITVIGLDQYGHQELAKDIAERWIGLIEKVYRDQGRFLEYYNVVEFGENEMDDDYPSDGYGPTIGVYLALKKYLDN